MCDSHKDLPIVEASEEELAVDLEPFEKLSWAPMGMMAHVVYTAWDADKPASQSPTVIGDIVRGQVGFDGWLMSDDLGMEALKGDFAERAAGVIAGGCDVALHCSGKMEEMVEVASAVTAMSSQAEERLRQAMIIASSTEEGPPFEELIAKRDELLALA
jgi:beta-N-acetylhexosaminidase